MLKRQKPGRKRDIISFVEYKQLVDNLIWYGIDAAEATEIVNNKLSRGVFRDEED